MFCRVPVFRSLLPAVAKSVTHEVFTRRRPELWACARPAASGRKGRQPDAPRGWAGRRAWNAWRPRLGSPRPAGRARALSCTVGRLRRAPSAPVNCTFRPALPFFNSLLDRVAAGRRARLSLRAMPPRPSRRRRQFHSDGQRRPRPAP